MNTLQAALVDEGWELSPHGTVRNPGKFEGQRWQTVCFWEKVMDSQADDEIFDEGDTLMSVFHLDDTERELYGFDKEDEVAVLSEDEYGFVSMSLWTAKDFDDFVDDIESAIEDRETDEF